MFRSATVNRRNSKGLQGRVLRSNLLLLWSFITRYVESFQAVDLTQI